MLIKNAKAEEINKYMKEDKLIVSVYAQYCGTCELMAPVLEKISKKILVVKLNVDENQDFVTKKKISGTPVHFLYRNGKEVARKTGFFPEEELLKGFN